ncbi:thioredoxin family protein [Aspergillus tubingensis]|uniref:thioredoxin family protein n=1 Tax=Aspergillus tubingensis TaxID=5068 RepID=UPI001578B6DD|nr:thioredoxin [Aspergillus tubingensis]GFN20223.1 thioredoxin [Aspergillus tubingensis]
MVVHAIKTNQNINSIIFGPAKFTEKAINSKKKVAVLFFATWAGPCINIRPAFEKLSDEYRSIEFYDVDVDDLDQLADDWGVAVFPTFFFFKDGAHLNDFTFRGGSPQGIMNGIHALQS